ncbi:hypothetical protein [Haloarcula salina]|uniref:Uncharacterized protein n=1 Tax=Haloarcula salina TaxID=1429914 RepID=A0AA41KKL9_9EURY|nr:hypothetical protein [Haloarcula salina]MBV0903938.1 hypothetical protein [Haloarcula salina]
MVEWLPDDLEPDDGTLADSAADATGSLVDWSVSPIQQATGFGPTATEVLDFTTGAYVEGPDEGDEYNENAVLTGPARSLFDYVQDYDGTWGGQEDQHDLAGPSIDFGALFDAQSDDPVFRRQSDPDAGPGLFGYGMVGVREAGALLAGLVVLYLAAPLLEIAAAGVDDG